MAVMIEQKGEQGAGMAALSGEASPIGLWSPSLAGLEARADYRRALLAVVVLAMVAGAGLRLWNLGALSLSVDEGFMALAADGILKRGAPVLDHGFAYVRSPVFTYMQAGCQAVLGQTNFALRLPAAVFGVLCIPVAYVMGRQVLGRTVGTVLAVLMAFSVWEIELSRYARFYTLFQMLWMLGVVLFYRGVIEDRRGSRAWFVVVVLLGMWVHALMIFMGALFLLAALWPGYSRGMRLTCVLLTAAFAPLRVLANKGFAAFEDYVLEPLGHVEPSGAYVGATYVANLSVVKNTVLPLYTPQWELLSAVWPGPWAIAALALGALAVAVIAAAGLRGEGWVKCSVAAAAVAAGACNQMGIVLVLVMAYAVVWVREWRDVRRTHVLTGLVALVLLGTVWVQVARNVGPHDLRRAVAMLFEFPNLHRYWLMWFLAGWPVMAMGLAAGVVVAASRAGRGSDGGGRGRPNEAWYAVLALLLPVLCAGLVKSKWTEARYFFHLYPQMMMLFALVPVVAAAWLGRVVGVRGPAGVAAVALVTLAATLVLSQDANPLKSVRIAQREHGQWRDPVKAIVNWGLAAHYHQDHDGAAAYVRERMQPDDLVIVVGPQHSAAVYLHRLGRIDYLFGLRQNYTRSVVNAKGQPIDDVANAVLIESLDELRAIIEGHNRGAVWIISDRKLSLPENWAVLDRSRTYLKDLTASPTFVARDDMQTVTKVVDGVPQPAAAEALP